MRLVDDLDNKEISIDSAIRLLQIAKEQGHDILKLSYGYAGYEQYVKVETEKKKKESNENR